MLEIVVEITKLTKLSLKREQHLASVKENFEIDNDNSLEQNHSLAKLCTTRWKVRANAFNKVINNFGHCLSSGTSAWVINLIKRLFPAY